VNGHATLHTPPLEVWAGSPVGSTVDTRPHVVAWNLTRRCNLACAHCYISAGAWHESAGELTTAEVRRITDEIVTLNAAPLFILSGGEPLLRDDLEEIAAYATSRGATVVIGTNGTRLTGERIEALRAAGVTGVAISIDSLDEQYHDRFRHGDGALADTLAAVDRLADQRLDFIVQTTVTRGNRAELERLAEWAAAHGAVAFNVYFLVETGRGAGMRGLEPAENEAVLVELTALERQYRGRMMVRAKCQPQLMRHALTSAADTPLRNYATRCPCGVQYCRITPDGKLTPCPYLPAEAGDLRTQSFADVWTQSPVLRALREGEPGGKCGRCEYRRVCGGCRARAFARTGDYLGPDDSCVYEPTGDVAVIAPATPVSYGAPAAATLPWDDDARARMQRVPSFVRGVVTARIENFARERGHARVSAELIDEVRRSMPIDFSKRRPFFMGGDA
jgi:radical SAM protein with 4Fe4S-binding SPASM domain